MIILNVSSEGTEIVKSSPSKRIRLYFCKSIGDYSISLVQDSEIIFKSFPGQAKLLYYKLEDNQKLIVSNTKFGRVKVL